MKHEDGKIMFWSCFAVAGPEFLILLEGTWGKFDSICQKIETGADADNGT